MKANNLTVEIKCIGADKTLMKLSRLGFNLFLIRLGLLDKEISDKKLRRKRKLQFIKEYKEMIIKQNENISKLRNAKGMEEFQKVYEELTNK